MRQPDCIGTEVVDLPKFVAFYHPIHNKIDRIFSVLVMHPVFHRTSLARAPTTTTTTATTTTIMVMLITLISSTAFGRNGTNAFLVQLCPFPVRWEIYRRVLECVSVGMCRRQYRVASGKCACNQAVPVRVCVYSCTGA